MIDVLPPAQMARWLRETAASTRAKGNLAWKGKELRVAAHVAFRIEQAADQLEQLRGTLSLAEEGLANYAQENERLKAALERIKALRYGLELHSDPEERAEYWSGMALEYRRIAAEALRPAEPQTLPQPAKE